MNSTSNHPNRRMDPSGKSDQRDHSRQRDESAHRSDATLKDGWLKIFCPEHSCEVLQNSDLP